MLQPGDDLDLPEETLRAERCRKLGVKHLERDHAIVLEVASEVYRCHPSASELALESVAVGEGLGQGGVGCGHETARWGTVGNVQRAVGESYVAVEHKPRRREGVFSQSPREAFQDE